MFFGDAQDVVIILLFGQPCSSLTMGMSATVSPESLTGWYTLPSGFPSVSLGTGAGLGRTFLIEDACSSMGSLNFIDGCFIVNKDVWRIADFFVFCYHNILDGNGFVFSGFVLRKCGIHSACHCIVEILGPIIGNIEVGAEF